MKISGISFGSKQTVLKITQSKSLVPLSKHKGPTLELTKEEDELVKKMENKVALYQLELMDLLQIQSNKKTALKQDAYNNIVGNIEYEIKKLNKKIKEIKVNRYRIQKEEYNKLQNL